MTMLPYVILFLLVVAIIGYFRWGQRLPPILLTWRRTSAPAPAVAITSVTPAQPRSLRWAAYPLFVAVFFVLPGAAIVYLWDEIVPMVTRWRNELTGSSATPTSGETWKTLLPQLSLEQPKQWLLQQQETLAAWWTPQTQLALLLAVVAIFLYAAGRKKWTFGVVALALLILVLPSDMTEDNWSGKFSMSLSRQCQSSNWTPATLTKSLLDLKNKDGYCLVDIRQESPGCIVIQRYNGEEVGPFCPGTKTVVLPKNMVALRSNSGLVKVSYKLFPP